MGTLDGKVAIVTGGSRGIGRAIAEKLGAERAAVVVGYTRQRDAAEEVVRAIEAAGGKARAEQADMAVPGDIRRLFLHTQDAYRQLDILINNAGVALFKPLADITAADYDHLFAVNVRSVFLAMQEAARVMADGGRIINLSSGVTQSAGPTSTLYAGTKGAVEQFTVAAAKELGKRGITVNTVSPGMTETDMLREAVPAARQEAMLQTAPLGRLGQPSDIADIVAFLVSDAGRWVTAQNIRATGGVG